MSPKTEKPRRGRGEQVKGRIEELEKRLAALEAHLRLLRGQARQSTGSARGRLTRLEKQAAARVKRVRETLERSLERLSEVLVASRTRVEWETGRLSRALRAGMKAGTEAYRRTRKG